MIYEEISRRYHRLRRKVYEGPQSIDLSVYRCEASGGRQADTERMALLGQFLKRIGRRLKDIEVNILTLDDEMLSIKEKLKKLEELTGKKITRSTYYYYKMRIAIKIGAWESLLKF